MAAEANKQAEADKMVVIGCCSTGSASGGHRAGTPPLLEPALQQSIKTILFVSAYLSASAASLVQGRWIYHKSTGPIGDWCTWVLGPGGPLHQSGENMPAAPAELGNTERDILSKNFR